MQSDELLDLIGEIKEEHIQDAKAPLSHMGKMGCGSSGGLPCAGGKHADLYAPGRLQRPRI